METKSSRTKFRIESMKIFNNFGLRPNKVNIMRKLHIATAVKKVKKQEINLVFHQVKYKEARTRQPTMGLATTTRRAYSRKIIVLKLTRQQICKAS
jgi:hypothetical protein